MNIKMKMTVASPATLATVMIAAGLLVAGAAQAQERVVRASLVLPKEHALGIGLNTLAQCVQLKSGGKLKLQPFFDGSLGNDAAALQQLRSGTLEILVTATSYMATVLPSAGIFDLPFLFANEREADAALDGKTGELLSQKLTTVGLVSVAYWENGFRNMTNSKKPIEKMEDLHGLKMRALPNPVMLATFKALGGFAIPMPFTELYSALETKAVDGQENPVNIVEGSKMYEVQKYLSITRHVYNPAVVVYSKRLFDQLSPEEQAVFRDCGASSSKEQRRVSREQAAGAMERLKTKGMLVNVVSDREIARMREATLSVHEAQASVLGSEMRDALKADLARVR